MRGVPDNAVSVRAFTLPELAIALFIGAVIAVIAVPRLSSAVTNAKKSGMLNSARTLQKAIELYTMEHAGLNPAQNPDRSIDNAPGQFKNRLVKRTLLTGVIDSAGPYGPYLRDIPPNPMNRLSTVRIAGAPAGNGAAGWRFDPAAGELLADDSPASAAATGK